MKTRLILCLFVAALLFSCNNNENNSDENISVAADVPAVTIGDSLPSDYKEKPVMAPISGVKVVRNPEDSVAPQIVANRLSIFFEDDETDLNAFAKDFKKLYPKDEYKIISYNDLLKTIEIQVPEDVLDVIRKGLETQMPDYQFIVTVETIYSQEQANGKCSDAGWHIDAINLREAWKTTKGSRKVVVAVVDDGFDVNHELLKGRVISPYNIFTADGNVYCNSTNGMHGTHVAGIAVGADTHINDGVTGIAPDCLLMPVQVFDGEQTTTFALATGILYAVASGADVINMSAGPSYAGCGDVPLDFQREFSKRCQKDEERLWKMVLSKAKKKNCIVVFSAGNDHVLSCLPPQNRTGEAIVVCASEKGDKATAFTNYADASTISAPGLDIYSSVPGNKYSCLDGTSMAAPVVSGIVALMKSQKPDITVSQVISALQESGVEQSGNIPNMVQADKALEYLDKPVTKGILNGQEWVDLGLPSGTLWKNKNEKGFYDYDAAVHSFGSKLPTKEQLEELKNSCKWIWTGSGFKVVGPNGVSIVLPADGYRGCGGRVGGVGSYGSYWSSTPYDSGIAWGLDFETGVVYSMDELSRCCGQSVRLVCNKKN